MSDHQTENEGNRNKSLYYDEGEWGEGRDSMEAFNVCKKTNRLTFYEPTDGNGLVGIATESAWDPHPTTNIAHDEVHYNSISLERTPPPPQQQQGILYLSIVLSILSKVMSLL